MNETIEVSRSELLMLCSGLEGIPIEEYNSKWA